MACDTLVHSLVSGSVPGADPIPRSHSPLALANLYNSSRSFVMTCEARSTLRSSRSFSWSLASHLLALLACRSLYRARTVYFHPLTLPTVCVGCAGLFPGLFFLRQQIAGHHPY